MPSSLMCLKKQVKTYLFNWASIDLIEFEIRLNLSKNGYPLISLVYQFHMQYIFQPTDILVDTICVSVFFPSTSKRKSQAEITHLPTRVVHRCTHPVCICTM